MSVVAAAGPVARSLSHLTWVLIVASAVVFGVVVVLMWAAVMRRPTTDAAVDLTPRSARIPIVGGAIIPAVILLALFLVSVLSERQYPVETRVSAQVFTVIGHQWWWEIHTADSGAAFANELHVPVGQVIEVRLLSADVIHSFWMPTLHGKIDLIPGDTNRIRLIADKPGVYRGQCAEYCGLQHANMAFTVVADAPDTYLRWLASQQQNAAPPADSLQRAGAALVTAGRCAVCHTIRGTPARGMVGPDLTHVGSRLTLAAGTLPNNAAAMEAWITNAPSLKPGTGMPALPQFSGMELRAMTAYLEGLH
jgi:cytochrome c oxidase subunit 2